MAQHLELNHIRIPYLTIRFFIILFILSPAITRAQDSSSSRPASKASIFKDGFARIVSGDSSVYIDSTGSYAFDTVLVSQDYYGNPNTFTLVSRQGKLGIVKQGAWILRPEYDTIDTRFAEWKITKAGKATWCDTTGRLLAPLRYDSMGYLDGRYFDVKRNGKWGIYDNSTDSLIIPCLYDGFDYCGGCGMKSDYVLAQKEGKWGILSFTGQIRIPFEYEHDHYRMRSDEWVTSFRQQDHFVLLNMATGLKMAEPEYSFNGDPLWYDRVCAGKKGKFALLDKYGTKITDFLYEDINLSDEQSGRNDTYACVKKNGKYGLIDTAGQIIVPIVHQDMLWAYNDSTFYSYGEKREMLLSRGGRHLLPEYYSSVSPLQTAGDTSASCLFSVTKLGKQGIFNRCTGKLSPIIYKDLSADRVTNFILAESNKKFGLYDRQGRKILPAIYEEIHGFYNYPDRIQVQLAKKEGLFDTSGKQLLAPKYDQIFQDFSDTNYLRLKVYSPKEDVEGIARIDGKIAVPPIFSSVIELSPRSFLLKKTGHNFYYNTQTGRKDSLPWKEAASAEEQEYLLVTKDSSTALFDPVNKKTLSAGYESIETFQGHTAAAQKKEKWGLIGLNGQPVTKFEYTKLSTLKRGLRFAQKDEYHYGFIDSTGREVSTFDYDLPSGTYSTEDFLNGDYFSLYKQKDGSSSLLQGLIRKDGHILLAPEYEILWKEESGRGFVIGKDGKFGIADSTGRIILQPVFDNIMVESANRFLHTANFSFPLLCYKDGVYQYYTSTGTPLSFRATELTTFEPTAL